jgi:ribosome maturation factor RimP
MVGKVSRLEKRPVKDIAKAVVERGLEGTGYELVDIQFKSERGQWYLNVFVDKPGGITLDDCELVNKLLDPILDAEAEIAGRHDYLTVSSPGLDRPIKTDADFRRNAGRLRKPRSTCDWQRSLNRRSRWAIWSWAFSWRCLPRSVSKKPWLLLRRR